MGDPNMCDPALLELFRAEMDTHVPVLSQGLLSLEKGRAGDKELEAMMRAAHSIKGAARIVGIEVAVRVAHVMEDCFSAAQGHRITLSSEAVDVLLQGVDALQRICAPQADAEFTEGSIQTLIDRIAAVRDAKACVPASQSSQGAFDSPAVVQRVTSTVMPHESRLILPADLDAAAAESLRSELSDILRGNPARIRLDFSQVQHLSAAGLSLLVSFVRETARAETVPVVDAEGLSAGMGVLLRTTGLDNTFKWTAG
jgi:two-component system sensor histidine kinase and response regulator WspE